MPLPTRQTVSRLRPPRLAGAAVLEHDQAGRVGAALADRQDPAHLAPLQLRDVEHAHAQAYLPGHALGGRGQRRGRQRVGGLVGELARQVLGLGQDHTGADRCPRGSQLGAALQAERHGGHAARGVRVFAQVGVEAVAGQHRAFGERLENGRRPQLAQRGNREDHARGLARRGLPDRAAGRRAERLGVKLLFVSDPEQQHAARRGRVPRIDQLRLARLAREVAARDHGSERAAQPAIERGRSGGQARRPVSFATGTTSRSAATAAGFRASTVIRITSPSPPGAAWLNSREPSPRLGGL